LFYVFFFGGSKKICTDQFTTEKGKVVLEGNENVARALEKLNLHRSKLHSVEFTTIVEYLYLFRGFCTAMGKLGHLGLIYACAAVSDFYLPESKMSEHKIQSRETNGLDLKLFPVPKLLGKMQEWCPNALKVTFKLETDPGMLDGKAEASMKSYGQDVVVGNLLSSHRVRVKLFFKNDGARVIEKTDEVELLEYLFVPVLIEYHKTKLEIL
jgi:phosphopantothenate-cysteine ligase